MDRITLYNADCFEVLKTMSDNSVDAVITDPPYYYIPFIYKKLLTTVNKWDIYLDMKTIEEQVISEYIPYKTSLRAVALIVGTDHHMVKRILEKNNIEIVRGMRAPFTDAHRAAMSKAHKGLVTWAKGKKMPKSTLYKNMASSLRFDVSPEWLEQFDDIEKLKFLNRSLGRPRDSKGFDTDKYKSFILKFYSDDKFNFLYKKWIETGDKWIKPSLDHINPRANGGKNEIDNFQFLSWLENRAKVDMTQEEWEKVKKNIEWYFYENN